VDLIRTRIEYDDTGKLTVWLRAIHLPTGITVDGGDTKLGPLLRELALTVEAANDT
jgi:hypothetical protein